jgi:thioredoxin 1
MKAIKDNEVENVLKSNKVIVIDCFGTWCHPCKLLAPTLETLNKELESKVEFLKLDVDENPEIPTKYNVRGVPTLLFFKNGKLVDQLVGNQSKEVITQVITKNS